MITNHALSADAFMSLADGAGDSAVVGQLREAQLSKHLMLLHVVAKAAGGVEYASRATAAFRAAYQVLAEVQAAVPDAVARLLGLPHIGSWAHDCLACLDNGLSPDFGYLAAVAATAAIRAGIRFELDVPVRDGRVPLPGLGCLRVVDHGGWIKLRSDGERLCDGEHLDVACATLVPDDGSGAAVHHWRGTPMVRAESNGQTWEVLLETDDRYLDRYRLPRLTVMTEVEANDWRQRIQAAWDLLVRHHEWAAGPLAETILVIVPLRPRSDLDSATSPAAFGAIATSLPQSPVSLAETLVHEFQHTKLAGVMDMLPLIKASDETGYAPWREDPRPVGGLLQGVYAFTGIVRFWDAQRYAETEPADVLRANVRYERWRMATELVTGTLLDKGCLTSAGVRFVSVLGERGQHQESGLVPAEATEIARELSLNHRLTWELSHTALDETGVADLAMAYHGGVPLGERVLPRTWIEAGIRKINPIPRSRALNELYQEPPLYRQLSVTALAELNADALPVPGDVGAAVTACREALAAGPDPAAWIGLTLAIHQLPASPSRSVLAARLPLLFEMHTYLAGQGMHADPLELAAWFE